jgi:hypothetical protein
METSLCPASRTMPAAPCRAGASLRSVLVYSHNGVPLRAERHVERAATAHRVHRFVKTVKLRHASGAQHKATPSLEGDASQMRVSAAPGPGPLPSATRTAPGPGLLPSATHTPPGPGPQPSATHTSPGPGPLPSATHTPPGPGPQPSATRTPRGPGLQAAAAIRSLPQREHSSALRPSAM